MSGQTLAWRGAPSLEDLYALRALCGSEEGTIAHLARCFDIPAETCAPVVHEWLEALPPIPPPSRQRSAPPVLAPAAHARIAAALASATGADIPSPFAAASSSLRIPPGSAPPAPGSGPGVIAAMRALDARLNNSTRSSHQHPGLPPSVPEDAPVSYMPESYLKPRASGGKAVADDGPGVSESETLAAYGAYVERRALVHGQSKHLAPTSFSSNSGEGKDAVPSTWMTRGAPKLNFR